MTVVRFIELNFEQFHQQSQTYAFRVPEKFSTLAYCNSTFLVVSWCCGSPNDVTFRPFCVSHYHKVQVFIQTLQILISANECKISVGLSVQTNSLTTFDLMKRGFNWHEPKNRQILSVCQYRQIHWQFLTQLSKGLNWHEPTTDNFCRFVSTDKFTDKFWLN